MRELLVSRSEKKAKMRSVGTRLTLEEYAALEALAKEKNTSISDILKQLVVLVLKEQEKIG